VPGRLASLVFAGLAGLAVFACDGPSEEAQLLTRQEAIDPPRLWEAKALIGRGIVLRTVRICADQKLRDSFRRAEPQVNSEPCRTVGPVVATPDLYALRCTAEGHRFGVTVTTRGDFDRAFEVSYSVAPLDLERGPFVQTVRYRLIGRCPIGWRIGDQREVDAAGTPVPPGETGGPRPGGVPALPS
jgi:hypothetical protein